MNKIRISCLLLLFLGIIFRTAAQQLSNPLDFPIQLSGEFCDLRANHFHAGIDFRTRGAEGHALHAVSNGYIARISVGPRGYGHAIFIAHPEEGIMTVYGHLQRFVHPIAVLVKDKQYKEERFAVDIRPEPGAMPVKRGDIIGYSGNTGNSGGPHLHFEVRDLKNNDYLDPLTFYKSRVTDTRKPLLKELMICPVEGKGVVNGAARKLKLTSKSNSHGNPYFDTPIEAWGDVGLAIRAVDPMDGSSFTYGLKEIRQTVDGRETFHCYTDRFSIDESRAVNSYIDYAEWSLNRLFYVRTFVEPGCNLRMVTSLRSGIFRIDEERNYQVIITLSDLFGNVCKAFIRIRGKRQEIQPVNTAGTHRMRWHDSNTFDTKGLRLHIPHNCLYDNLRMRYRAASSAGYRSTVHVLHPTPVPLHRPAQLSIYIDSARGESLADARRMGIVRISRNGRRIWIGGVVRDGWITADINELGSYAVAYDRTAPQITPLDQDKWQARKQISIRITDDLSGIFSFRGEIDGRYALFEWDPKQSLLTYTFDPERLSGGRHRLKLRLMDACGNRAVAEYTFVR
jgi:murein DD-endopeptidase MepM/ murein hydrolase activator NlpD